MSKTIYLNTKEFCNIKKCLTFDQMNAFHFKSFPIKKKKTTEEKCILIVFLM